VAPAANTAVATAARPAFRSICFEINLDILILLEATQHAQRYAHAVFVSSRSSDRHRFRRANPRSGGCRRLYEGDARPLDRGFDRLGEHGGQSLWLDQQLDASSGARRSPDQSCAFESEHHLVDGWWSDAEVTLHVGFGWSAAEDAGIGMDEGKILALFCGEGRDRGVHVT
jgi:hypothetical protein